MVQKMGGRAIKMFSDLRSVLGQVEGELEARDPRMQEYFNQVRHLRSGFWSFTLLQIPRSKNTHADSLAMLATPRYKIYLRLSLWKTCVNPLK